MSYEDHLDELGNVCFYKVHKDVMRQQFERDLNRRLAPHRPESLDRLRKLGNANWDNQPSPSTGILGAHSVPVGTPIPKHKQSNIEEHLYTLLGMALHHGCDDMVDKIQMIIEEL